MTLRKFKMASVFGVAALLPIVLGGSVWSSAAAAEPPASSMEQSSDDTSPDSYTGGGVTTINASISPGVPPVTYLGPCVANTYDLDIDALGSITGDGKAFYGPLDVTGTASGCDTFLHGEGTSTITISGNAGGTSVSCADLTGPFHRVATNLSMMVVKTCTITDAAGSKTFPCYIYIDLAEGVLTEFDSRLYATKAVFVGEFTMTDEPRGW
jgi:hypothetical protein